MEKFIFVVTTARKLNAKTVARQFPLPRVDELIDNMRNSSIYSVIDLKSGYFQISLKEEDREKTALVLPWGKYRWKRMPQGLLGAPFTFAENISHIFSDMTSFVSAYFDDIAIFSATEEEHYTCMFRKSLLDSLSVIYASICVSVNGFNQKLNFWAILSLKRRHL